MIDSIYKLVQVISNKEYRGHISPASLNLLGKQAQEKIFRGYFDDENRDKIRAKRGMVERGYANITMVQRERMDNFSKTASLSYSDPYFLFPNDLYMIKDRGLSYQGKFIRELQTQDISSIGLSKAAASETFPAYYKESSGLIVMPSSITNSVSLRYFKTPTDPKWTYTVVGGVEMFNPSAGDYQDFELHPSEYYNICINILSPLGINLSQTELAQYAEALKQKQNIKEEQ